MIQRPLLQRIGIALLVVVAQGVLISAPTTLQLRLSIPVLLLHLTRHAVEYLRRTGLAGVVRLQVVGLHAVSADLRAVWAVETRGVGAVVSANQTAHQDESRT